MILGPNGEGNQRSGGGNRNLLNLTHPGSFNLHYYKIYRIYVAYRILFAIEASSVPLSAAFLKVALMMAKGDIFCFRGSPISLVGR